MNTPFSKFLVLALILSFGAASRAADQPAAKTENVAPTPAAAKVIEQLADGTVSLHARDVTIHGTTVRYEPQPHKNTIGYWSKVNDWVSWDFKLSKPGKFSVVMLQGCGKGSGGSEYTISVGDQVLKDVVPDTGAFSNFVSRIVGTIELKTEGPFTLSVKPQTKPGVAVMDLRLITLQPVAK